MGRVMKTKEGGQEIVAEQEEEACLYHSVTFLQRDSQTASSDEEGEGGGLLQCNLRSQYSCCKSLWNEIFGLLFF